MAAFCLVAKRSKKFSYDIFLTLAAFLAGLSESDMKGCLVHSTSLVSKMLQSPYV